MERIDIFEEHRRLRQDFENEKRKRKEERKRRLELEKRVKELEKILARFLNANTPSSKFPPGFTPKGTSPDRKPKGTNPRGKPKGSNGGTREEPDHMDKKVDVQAEECPNGHKTIKETDVHVRITYEIPKIEIMMTEFTVHEYDCNTCGVHFEATHSDLPLEGIFGPNLQAFLTEVRHNFAGSYEKISVFLDGITGITFSAQGIKDCVKRVARDLKPSYEKMEKEVKKSGVVHSDETSWPLDGQGWWLWLLCTTNLVFIMINKSRARKVITNVLGEHFPGTIVSDCLSVYRNFAASFQRCWSHLLRKTHFEKDKKPKGDITKLHEQLTLLYKEVTAFIESKPSFDQRVWNAIMYNQRLQRITNHRWRSDSAKKIVKSMLKSFQGQWLVGVIIPDVELTNNKSERGIRKVIPARKLLGGHRTKNGAEDFAIIETHRQTWRLRGESPFCKLAEYLRKCYAKPIVSC